MNALQLLANALAACAKHLDKDTDVLRARGQCEAADCAQAISLLTQSALKGSTFSEMNRAKALLSVASLHALPQGNGFGEAVIWSGYRRAGMHRHCEEWTELTNEVRHLRVLLQEQQAA